ncbi:MAG: DNA-binding protein [Verrucomicrobia bacterium]|nr:DNA-binding protein [Verrucomicrobiota bacterium]
MAANSWAPLEGLPPLTPAVLAEILDRGQAFRWNPDPAAGPAAFSGLWGRHAVHVRLGAGGRPEWAPAGSVTGPADLAAYFAAGTDFAAATNALPWRSDAHLARCVAAFPGLRLLRQPFGETLLAFLCSATKQIVQIKQMVELLAARLGRPLFPGGPHALPGWAELAAVPESELRRCLLGFRARHVAGTARYLAARPGWLEETEDLPYAAAHARLLELPGVGTKVADCVLLFGAGRLEAFPVDTWILQALARHYGLEGWSPAQVAHFGRAHFGPQAGLAQQFLFAWERGQRRPLSGAPAGSVPPRSPRGRR